MSNIMNDLHAVGLNPFAVTLLAESLLKSPLAQLTTTRPQGFFFPVKRGDCPGWIGVRFTLEAVGETECAPTNRLQPHQQRVVDEKAELDTKATALSKFIGESTIFPTIDAVEQERLKEQCEVMWHYSEILGARIAAFGQSA